MYAQITTLCNMECPHCCFSCGPSRPYEHMSRDTFAHCVALCEATGSIIQLGGGEPTCHPEFWEYLKKAINSSVEGVWLATNGLRRDDCTLLAELGGPYHEEAWCNRWDEESGETAQDPRLEGTCPGEWGRFSATLSVDGYHDPIHASVVQAFKANRCELRDNAGRLSNSGAARANFLPGEDKCCCEEIHIKPSGRVQMCGCDESLQLGHIMDYDEDTWFALLQELYETQDEHEYCGHYGMKDEHGMYRVQLARRLTSVIEEREEREEIAA